MLTVNVIIKWVPEHNHYSGSFVDATFSNLTVVADKIDLVKILLVNALQVLLAHKLGLSYEYQVVTQSCINNKFNDIDIADSSSTYALRIL